MSLAPYGAGDKSDESEDEIKNKKTLAHVGFNWKPN